MATSNENGFSNLKALYLNCTLKRSPKSSHTQNLIDKSIEIMETNGVAVEHLRPVDYDLPPGIQLDMSKEGYDKDDWPDIQQKVLDADILVIGSPIWLGQKSAVCKNVIERLYAYSGKLNENQQSIYYGRVGGSIVTGNEDGYKHNGAYILYSLQHIGFLIPPQTDTGWVGPAGPGPSYGDEGENGPVGYDNEFTQNTNRIMTWNLMHLAKMVKDADGIPVEGNQRSE